MWKNICREPKYDRLLHFPDSNSQSESLFVHVWGSQVQPSLVFKSTKDLSMCSLKSYPTHIVWFSFRIHQLSITFVTLCLPQDIFGNGTPCWNSELSSVYWASLTTSSLWCKSSHKDRPELNLSFPVLILFAVSFLCAIVLCLSHGPRAEENVRINTSAKPLVL